MDTNRAARAAEIMALRILLSNLYAEVLGRRPDGLARMREIEKATSDAADQLDVRKFSSEDGEVFRHLYLHELETFWKGVELHFPPDAAG